MFLFIWIIHPEIKKELWIAIGIIMQRIARLNDSRGKLRVITIRFEKKNEWARCA